MDTNQREIAEATLHHHKLSPLRMRDEKSDLLDKKIIRSEDLFGGNRQIIIEHGIARYRLQITKAGKLILNK